MASASIEPYPRIALEPAALDGFAERVRAALDGGATAGVILGLEAVSYGDPAVLAALQRAGEEGRRREKAVLLDGIAPDLYKALHVAGMAHLFTRVA